MTHIGDRREPRFEGDIGDRMRAPIAAPGMPSGLGAEQPVLDAQSLIDRLGLGNAIEVLRIKLAFPAEVFALAARPLIDGHAKFVQMLPVLGSGCVGSEGGQLNRALATALRSLARRRGQILPRGAAPEVIGAQAHRWTYAVFVAALLRDLAHVGDGMRVWMVVGAGAPRSWKPAEGSMRTCGAVAYSVETLPPEVLPDEVDAAIALQLFERCVPDAIQNWLGEDAALMAELRACLSGHADPAGVISEFLGCVAPSRPPGRAPVVGPAPKVTAAPFVVEPSSPAPQSVLTEDPPEFLAAVSPDESALARQFMAWLSQGLLGGTLSVNKPDAFVHRVAEGLLLASPRIFQAFVKQQAMGPEDAADADAVKRVQREVLREGWHLRADRGVNILCYERRRFGRGSTRINGIVITEPQRFIQPLPAIDSTLVRVLDRASVAP
jgi:hypothetical protein